MLGDIDGRAAHAVTKDPYVLDFIIDLAEGAKEREHIGRAAARLGLPGGLPAASGSPAGDQPGLRALVAHPEPSAYACSLPSLVQLS